MSNGTSKIKHEQVRKRMKNYFTRINDKIHHHPGRVERYHRIRRWLNINHVLEITIRSSSSFYSEQLDSLSPYLPPFSEEPYIDPPEKYVPVGQILCKSGEIRDKVYYWLENAPTFEDVALCFYFNPEKLKRATPDTINWFYEQWQYQNM